MTIPRSHSGLVRLAARRAVRHGIEYEEAVQDGTVGLLGAMDRYDESRGLAFVRQKRFWGLVFRRVGENSRIRVTNGPSADKAM